MLLPALLLALASLFHTVDSTNTTSCSSGLWDCRFQDKDDDACADHNGDWKDPDDLLGAVIFAAVAMCLMAFNIGANDAANSWATSVGSGAISLTKATIIAGVFEWAGAVSLGAGVSTKVSKAVSDIQDEDCWACGYCDSQMSVYAVGMIGALVGASVFLLLATFTKMPVSTTHAIVGGIVGMTMAGVGGDCVTWGLDGVGGIVLSWAVSPVLSGLIGAGSYAFTKAFILDANAPLHRACVFMPFLYGAVSWVMSFLIMIKAQATKDLEFWVQLVAACVCGAIGTGCGSLFVNKYLNDVRTQRLASIAAQHQPLPPCETTGVQLSPPKCADPKSPHGMELAPPKCADPDAISVDFQAAMEEVHPGLSDDQADAVYVFRFLLVFNAALESFAHGSNDTANSTAAFTATWQTYDNGLHSCEQKATPTWIMAIGGLFVMLGVYGLGYRVIETVGKNLTKVDFHSAWCIEFASTVTVVVATMLEMPVSTTHCQVGAVAAVGYTALGASKVNWWELWRIVLSWILTVPFAGLLAGVIVLTFRPAVCASCPWNQ